MSYRQISLNIEEEKKIIEEEKKIEIIQDFFNSYDYMDGIIDEMGHSQGFENYCEMDDNLIPFSKKYPDLLFIMEEVGENPGEWNFLYIKDGKSQLDEGKTVFEGYNPDKLT